MTTVVVSLNCLIALLVLGLTCGLWRCMLWLRALNVQLHEIELSPQQVRYAIALKRVQLAETRLDVGLWQRRSRQIYQALRLIQLLQWVLLYRRRSGRRSSR